MLWLIWIVIMLMVPLLVGVHVWLQTRQETIESRAMGGQDEQAVS